LVRAAAAGPAAFPAPLPAAPVLALPAQIRFLTLTRMGAFAQAEDPLHFLLLGDVLRFVFGDDTTQVVRDDEDPTLHIACAIVQGFFRKNSAPWFLRQCADRKRGKHRSPGYHRSAAPKPVKPCHQQGSGGLCISPVYSGVAACTAAVRLRSGSMTLRLFPSLC